MVTDGYTACQGMKPKDEADGVAQTWQYEQNIL
jgi:hypothetical protein